MLWAWLAAVLAFLFNPSAALSALLPWNIPDM